jgi:hypothetical protein
MKTKKLKKIIELFGWCYYAPDGFPQVRSLDDSKKACRASISEHESITWKDYEKAGYVLKRVVFTILPIDTL